MAQWPPSAPALLSDSRRRPDHVPSYGRSGSADYVSTPLSLTSGSGILDTTGASCPRVPRRVPQSAVQIRPRFLLLELILAHSPVRSSPLHPRKSPHQSPIGSPSEEVAHTECATIMFQAIVNY